jgi:hypothetical protein
MSLNKSIIDIRVKLQNSKTKKSGKNRFAGFEYYELADFLPTLNQLMQAAGVNDVFTVEDGEAKLTLIKDDQEQEYKMPFVMFDVPLNKNGQPSMQAIQYLGALNTYYKRYLYLNAFGITDGEVIDAMEAPVYKTQSKQTEDDKKAYWNEFTQFCASLDCDPMDFLTEFAEVDPTDKKQMFNAVSKYLKDKDMFTEQLMNFKEFKNANK